MDIELNEKLSSIIDTLRVQQDQITSLTKVVLKNVDPFEKDCEAIDDLSYKSFIYDKISPTANLVLGGVSADTLRSELLSNKMMKEIWCITHEKYPTLLEDILNTIICSNWESLHFLGSEDKKDIYINSFISACNWLVKKLDDGSDEKCIFNSRNILLFLTRDKSGNVRLYGGFMVLKTYSTPYIS